MGFWGDPLGAGPWSTVLAAVIQKAPGASSAALGCRLPQRPDTTLLPSTPTVPTPSVASTAAQQALRDRFGPWAVVTGASDGIGRAFAWDLARAGVHLVLAARRRHALTDLAQALTTDTGVETRVVACDLSTDAGLHELMRETDRLDIGLLVAAAGFGSAGPFIDQSLSNELAMIDLNCRAVAQLSHHFGRRFANRARGGIVLFGSILGFAGVPLSANYAATKAYVQSLAEGLHAELAPLGVAVLAVAPGPTASGFAARAALKMSNAMSSDVVSRVALGALGRMTTVRPGVMTKILDGSLRIVPRLIRSRILGLVMRGMTADQSPRTARRSA